MLSFVKSLASDQDGATAIEYGLIAGLIAVAIIAALSTVATDLNGLFGKVGAALTSA
jgi:pilus assembly protein Flp/PilA